MKTVNFLFHFLIIWVVQYSYVFAYETEPADYAIKNLQEIHSKFELIHGRVIDEYPEQLMVATYLPPDAKVLELGGHAGRNSCVIATILNDSRNLVTLESNQEFVTNMYENRDHNRLQFHIEASALSKRPLIQSGWVSIPGEVVLPGYFRVHTITFDELQKKYNIEFDTLVADCEGALYYVLLDDPDILRNIKLVIVENDYPNQDRLCYTTDLYKENGLELVYSGSYGEAHNFYQVWKK